ncbi:3,4-dihydroxy-2-butanone-4-phosphate synthase [Clostridium estertheticum]|uniref:3,4-dihydroxy-2-butanone-4-phosphate synthase n=1 Tax=Clostridium estertheticum TaxID=238834 RepID=UPI00124D77FC|nr:3,4-dihydroxy-2-butanone-4-phosphate synthase [Clostridium estertheticum]MBZ9618288.1 3,4-dihydroxy-2-butanone-4-phosphate synthase [Clostridium estertheticum subsp. laramiense]WAG76212.1 3,4-dihydroxy-2-butanone-4-phosphate synthase [Clostridium estertheticum]
MNESLLNHFGNNLQRVEKALSVLRQGKGIIIVDDESRENEGDLIFPAETLTVPQMAMLIRECSGIVCLCLTEDKIKELNLPQMVPNNTCKYETAFTISIEAKEGVTTGVSAADRVTTILTAVKDDCKPEDLCHPGHVFPLCARTGGILVRRGHTEGTVDLMRLAGHKPTGILCELTNIDGTMMKLPQIIEFAKKHDMTVVSIEDIFEYKQSM